MPTLLELQQAVSRSLLAQDDHAAAMHILADGIAPAARLNIYRNTFIGTLTSALRLSFPAVYRLVGAGFFETVARLFIEAEPPQSAYLNDYGGALPGFLAGYGPAASLPYLVGVARLEWAVNRALHATDAETLEVSRLTQLAAELHGSLAFVPHPSVTLIHADHPVDAIWRAVLAEDDRALAAIELADGPVWLLVQRETDGVTVIRMAEPAWRFASELFASRPLGRAVEAFPALDASLLLAEHLVAQRFIGFQLIDQPGASPSPKEQAQ
jgi:hypothetical protein